MQTLDKVKKLLEVNLDADFGNRSEVLKQMLEQNIGSDGPFYPLVMIHEYYPSTTPKKKSFLINIKVKNNNSITYIAHYKELNTLKDMAAVVVAKSLSEESDVDTLENIPIPKCLLEDVSSWFKLLHELN